MPTNKTKKKTILVTGATGHQGGASLRHLRERGFPVRALTRDPDQPKARALTGHGVEVVRGDMEDSNSLGRAMDEIHGVHSVQSSQAGAEGEIRQGIHLADAAKRSGIAHFVYSSVGSADQKTGIPVFESKFRIEQHIRGTGLPFTIVRPVAFMENWLGMRQQIENGVLRLPLTPETRLQMIAVDDIGAVIAMALEKPGKWHGRTIELAGDELSMAELAQAFSVSAGHDVRYVQVPWDEFENQAGKEVGQIYRWYQDTGYHADIALVRQEYPALTTLGRWLNSYWHAATQTAR
jgi:uncharacterized protein YbjT (DUF2867 family)